MSDDTVHMRQLAHPAFTYCGLMVDVRDGETGELLRFLTTTNFDEQVTCGGCR